MPVYLTDDDGALLLDDDYSYLVEMADPVLTTKWQRMGVIPLTDLEYWHALDSAVSGEEVSDFSGHNRPMTATGSIPQIAPVLFNGKTGIYFDGTNSPLKTASNSVKLKHIFIVAAISGNTFAGNEGLISDLDTNALLVGNGAGSTTFYNNGYASALGYSYRKNYALFNEDNQQAPMNAFALIELRFASDVFFNGLQIGQDRTNTTRKLNGWWCETLAYSTLQTGTNYDRIMLYFNLKFHFHKKGVPLRFPDPTLTGVKYSRFWDQQPEYERITESIEFADAGRTFNELGSKAPRRWDIHFNNRTNDKRYIFDEFDNAAKRAFPFTLLDRYGETHTGVRIENYERNHEVKKAFEQKHDCRFRLIKYR